MRVELVQQQAGTGGDWTDLSSHLHCVQNSIVTRGYRGGDAAGGLSIAVGIKLPNESYDICLCNL